MLETIADHLTAQLHQHGYTVRVIPTVHSILLEISVSLYGMDNWTAKVSDIIITPGHIRTNILRVGSTCAFIVDMADPDAFSKTINHMLEHHHPTNHHAPNRK